MVWYAACYIQYHDMSKGLRKILASRPVYWETGRTRTFRRLKARTIQSASGEHARSSKMPESSCKQSQNFEVLRDVLGNTRVMRTCLGDRWRECTAQTLCQLEALSRPGGGTRTGTGPRTTGWSGGPRTSGSRGRTPVGLAGGDGRTAVRAPGTPDGSSDAHRRAALCCNEARSPFLHRASSRIASPPHSDLHAPIRSLPSWALGGWQEDPTQSIYRGCSAAGHRRHPPGDFTRASTAERDSTSSAPSRPGLGPNSEASDTGRASSLWLSDA